MTKVYLDAGSCGYQVVIIANKKKDGKIGIILDTTCEMVKAMEEDLKSQDRKKVLRRIIDSPVYISASKRIKHVGCPVPMAITKAIEVELGISVPQEVKLTFA